MRNRFHMSRGRTHSLVLLLLLIAAARLASQPTEGWDHRFTSFSVEGDVRGTAIRDGRIYIGGTFTKAAGFAVGGIAGWNPATGEWAPLRAGVDGPVRAMTFDDAGNLYVVGLFSAAGDVIANGIAKWDGDQWHDLAGGVGGGSSSVSAIAVDGTNVYIGGNFASVGGVPAANVARWDGSKWSALGGGVSGPVAALAFGNGNLYVGGRFSTAGTLATNGLAVWNGTDWSTPADSIRGGNPIVLGLYADDDALYVGGAFTGIDEATSANIAKLNIATDRWENLGNGVSGTVQTIDADAEHLYIGGEFTLGSSTKKVNLAVLNGSTWSALGGGVIGTVYDITGDNTTLVIGGALTQSGKPIAKGVARWSKVDQTWISPGYAPIGPVSSMATVDDEIYVAGDFLGYDTIASRGIGMWDGTSWHDLQGGSSGPVDVVLPNGDDVYVGGGFNVMGGNGAATAVARWRRSAGTWAPLATGVLGRVYALAMLNDTLLVGGRFTVEGIKNIAKWDGARWLPVGDGVDGTVYSIVVTDPGIVVGGDLTAAGSTPVGNIAVWNGSTWGPLGNDPNNGTDGTVYSIASGPQGDLYVGGDFTSVANQPTENIARWHNGTWSALGEGVDDEVRRLVVHNGYLYAGGAFIDAGDLTVEGIARWSIAQEQWSGVGGVRGDPGATVNAITFKDRDLYLGGNFPMAGDRQSWNMARHASFVTSVENGAGRPESPTGTAAELFTAPNPTGGHATLSLLLPTAGRVSITIHSAIGTEIARLADTDLSSGLHRFVWDTRKAPEGTYFATLTMNGLTQTQRIVVLH